MSNWLHTTWTLQFVLALGFSGSAVAQVQRAVGPRDNASPVTRSSDFMPLEGTAPARQYGLFTHDVAYTWNEECPTSLAVGDLGEDLNSDNDLVVTARCTAPTNHNVFVLFNDGDATFVWDDTYDSGCQAHSVALDDLDSDLHNDFAVVCLSDQYVYVSLNNGDGSFVPRINYALRASPTHGLPSVAIGDLDGVHGRDLVVSWPNCDCPSVTVLLNLGDGTFEQIPKPYPDFPYVSPYYTEYEVGLYPQSVAIEDVDGVNGPDLAVATGRGGGGGRVYVLCNKGDGTFDACAGSPAYYTVGYNLVSIAIGDLDGVNGPDLLVADGEEEQVGILFNDGDGTYDGLCPVYYNVGRFPHSVTIADLDDDKNLDLAVANRDDNTVSILLNDGSGGFPQQTFCPAGDGPHFVAAGDLDNDGDKDLAVADYEGHTVSVLYNHTYHAILYAPRPEDTLPEACLPGSPIECPEEAQCIAGRCYVPKNRYISIASHPNQIPYTARRVKLGNPQGSTLGWVGEPYLSNNLHVALIVDTPFYANTWPDVLHVAGCEVAPKNSPHGGGPDYCIQAIQQGHDIGVEDNYSEQVILPTASTWGDVVGTCPDNVCTPPQGVVNLDDLTAVVKCFQGASSPPLTWADLAPCDDCDYPNHVCNLDDYLRVLHAFQGIQYPGCGPLNCDPCCEK